MRPEHVPTRLPLVAAAALLALSLAACGGGGSGSSSSSSSKVASAADAAKVVGCSSSTPFDTDELFVTDAAVCSAGGGDVTVYYFSTNDARDSYVKAASGFGGQYLVGDHWAVDAVPSVLQSLKSSAGGEIKP